VIGQSRRGILLRNRSRRHGRFDGRLDLLLGLAISRLIVSF
jgi:hypothetical protein